MIEMFENLFNVYSNESITTSTILSVLLMVTILSVYEFFVYRFISHRSFYNKSYNITIAILPYFIATIILCLQSNIIITLGTIGALAIIRFRTAVKDPVDMLYLLWSVYVGIICGCQLYEVGVLTCIVVTVILIILDHINFGRKPYILILHAEEDIEENFVQFLEEKKISYKLKSRNYTNKGYDYAIEFTSKKLNDLKEQLQNNKKVTKYSIIEYDADDIV
ncbi:MAG: DUF4956 domain-containing protein [Bacilli bacterium]|nr:DUF4956 domain-containing protein [Bacilli bacterium]